MPELTWPSKGGVPVQPASLVTDSLIFPNGNGYPDRSTENRLILGDNLSIMYSLLPAYEGKINLIYADPPFFTNRKYRARGGFTQARRMADGRRLSRSLGRTGYVSRFFVPAAHPHVSPAGPQRNF